MTTASPNDGTCRSRRSAIGTVGVIALRRTRSRVWAVASRLLSISEHRGGGSSLSRNRMRGSARTIAPPSAQKDAPFHPPVASADVDRRAESHQLPQLLDLGVWHAYAAVGYASGDQLG